MSKKNRRNEVRKKTNSVIQENKKALTCPYDRSIDCFSGCLFRKQTPIAFRENIDGIYCRRLLIMEVEREAIPPVDLPEPEKEEGYSGEVSGEDVTLINTGINTGDRQEE